MTEAAYVSPLGAVAIAPGFYFGLDNGVRISSWNSASGVVLTVAGQMLTEDGTVRDFSFQHTPLTTRAEQQTDFRVGCGWLIAAHVFPSSGTPQRGQCFVRLQVLQGFTGAKIAIGTVLQDYVAANAAVAWPGSPLRASSEGPGVARVLAETAPGGGSEFVVSVPTGARWRLFAFSVSFVASGAAANRRPVFRVQAAAGIVWQTSSAVDVTAGQTAVYHAGVGAAFFTYGTRAYHLPLPGDLVLPQGASITSLTALIDGGDAYSDIIVAVEEWIEP